MQKDRERTNNKWWIWKNERERPHNYERKRNILVTTNEWEQERTSEKKQMKRKQRRTLKKDQIEWTRMNAPERMRENE